MPWRDLFFPGNPIRREMLFHKSLVLQEIMRSNFMAANQLTEALRIHLGLSFSWITLNEKATVKENCNVIIQRIHEIQAAVEKIDQKLKEKLEPTLYVKLKNTSMSDPKHNHIAKVLHCIFGVAAAASIPLTGWLICSGSILTTMTSLFGLFSTISFAFIGLAVIFLGIFQAIIGAIERAHLENTLKKEYGKALEEFSLASDKYQNSITYVMMRLENLPKN